MKVTASILALLLAACGNGTGGQDDTSTDVPPDAADTVSDTASDPAPEDTGLDDTVEVDSAEDTPADPAADTTADTPADWAADTTGDTPADAPTDTPEDAPDAGDTIVDTEADDDTPMDPPSDTCPDAPGDPADADGSLPYPYLLTSDKGAEYPMGSPCNLDGSSVEELVLTPTCGGCVHVDHYCAWMNCCTTLVSSLGYTPPAGLEIVETETGSYCFCEGWFSPGYDVCGLSPGLWDVAIDPLDADVTVP